MESAEAISLKHIMANHKSSVVINLVLLTLEVALMALVPLFIGFAIDDLLAQKTDALFTLVAVLVALVIVSVTRRYYDTRAYGKIRVNVQTEVVNRNKTLATSVLNARLDMARELVDFLEQNVAEILNGAVQFVVSLLVLYFLNPMLALAAAGAAIAMIVIYSFFHNGFYVLNRTYNEQTERQVKVLERRTPSRLKVHFSRLMKLEVKLSDREAILYGSVFVVLLSMVVFNLWYATLSGNISAGTIFSIVSYSWEFVEAAVVLPVTLQSLTRLAEITDRINNSGS